MENPENDKPTYEELALRNQALIRELTESKLETKGLWMMLAGANRRLQISSAAIKAAVSSLLNYDIFWDGANQHEFLETINTSVDQAGRIVKLMTLAFRLEAGTLVIKREPQVLQEIISIVQDHITTRFPHLAFGLTLPQTGESAQVDYEYLMIALEYIFEAIENMGVRRVGIQAVEEPDCWALKFEGLDNHVLQILQSTYEKRVDGSDNAATSQIAPEQLLKLNVAFQILKSQAIQIEITDNAANTPKMRLIIPTKLSN
ncbi:MAG: hypothetical protein AB9891_03735 [Anaerolineaceae bacterium]